MASKGQKKKDSGRASAASKEGTASSVKGVESKVTARQQFTIWPEWSDADVNSEKWDSQQKAGGKEKGKSPNMQFFDDPDGVLELPPALEVSQWKRLHEQFQDRIPVVVDDPGAMSFDLLTANEHIHHCETIRWIISQITALWKLNGTSMAFVPELGSSSQTEFISWKPWEHIYAMSKLGKGPPNLPQYNNYGKYVVRLFWMGCWRKIYVDDSLPFDQHNNILLPTTTNTYELWPMLLSKAIIKVLSLDYSAGNIDCEFGEQSVMQCLTGWLPEPVPVMSSYMDKIWDLLKTSCPEFTLPDPNDPKPGGDLSNQSSDIPDGLKKDSEVPLATTKEAGASKDTKKGGKDGKKDRGGMTTPLHDGHGGGKGHKGGIGKQASQVSIAASENRMMFGLGNRSTTPFDSAEPVRVEKPQTVVFATYYNPPRLPRTYSKYKDTSDTAETLRTVGLSHSLPHPLLVTRTRSCPLVAPPIPPPEPAWKLIRQPRKKNFQNVSDQPPEEEKLRPEQWVEISSPYLNYKLSPTTLPREVTGRRSSSRSRDGSRPSTAPPVQEVDENPPPPKAEHPSSSPDGAPGVNNIQPVPPNQPKPQSKGASSVAEQASVGERSALGSKESQNKATPAPTEKRTSHVSAVSSGANQSKKGVGEGAGLDSNAVPGDLKQETVTVDGKIVPTIEEKKTDSWVHWEDFKKAFKSVILYHKPQSYPYRETSSDFKVHRLFNRHGSIVQSTATTFHMMGRRTSLGGQSLASNQSLTVPSFNLMPPHTGGGGGGAFAQSAVGGKKAAGGASAGGQSKLGGAQSPAMSGSGDDRQPIFFSVDSLKPIQVLISFSALSKWIEPSSSSQAGFDSTSATASQQVASAAPLPGTQNSAAGNKLRMDKKSATFLSEAPTIFSDHESNKDGPVVSGGIYEAFKRRAAFTPGILVAEPYTWKSLVIGNPILSVKTTGAKSVLLNLAPGRHILRFHINAPLAWVVNLCSTTRFYFGDEENVMSTVVNESLRFQEHAMQLVQKIGRAIQNFSDPESFKEAIDEMKQCYNPTEEIPDNIEVFRKAFYMTVGDLMGDALTSDAVFGLRCLTCDLQTESVMEAAVGRKNPESARANQLPRTPRKSSVFKFGHNVPHLKKISVSSAPSLSSPLFQLGKSTTSALDIWKERDPTDEELGSVSTIQSAWKGFYTRAVIASREIGSTEHNKAREQLQKVWSFLENNMDTCGLTLLRAMFRLDPTQLQRFPFSSDEWTKIAYADYTGQFGEQTSSTWFVLFRSVFTVEDPVLLVPKLTSSIHTAFLRVVDNDTGKEIPKVFMRVAPYTFTKNQKGYTFFCEARTTDLPVANGRWRMRLIGNQAPLPTPIGAGEVNSNLNSSFFTREIKDYYVPNEKNIVFRYSVKVTEDHLLSFQLQTSKSDVYIELEILDHEQVLLSSRGKGHTVLPAFIFHSDSSSSSGGSRGALVDRKDPDEAVDPKNASKTKRSVSGDRKASANKKATEVQIAADQSAPAEKEAEPETKPHKYIIQARVLRKSWPISQSAWAHVAMLKEQEKEEMKANFDERPGSSRSNAAGGAKSAKQSTSKNLKPEKSAKGAQSRPISQQFDNEKPHWLLRVVIDTSENQQGDCEIKKDTERIEQIRAMKQAWERADPGRAERAAARRAAFLAKYMIPVDPPAVEAESGRESAATKAADDKESAAPVETVVTELTPEPAPTSKSVASGKSRKQSMNRETTQITEDSGAAGASEVPEVPEVLTLEPPPGPPPKTVLKPLDLTPYTIKAKDGVRVLVDEEELSREREEKVRQFSEWNRVRQEMKRRREEELEKRNQEKVKQIQDYEALQEMVDQTRAEIAARKEAYRQRILQAEQEKQDALSALENGVNLEAEKPTSASKKGGKKSPKSSAKGSKKGSAKGKKK
ncbi:androglobin-like isoform X5 [Symsagittifera roscoffensis]|uniref:androglobin-like isoform X5 n=1 Tax=Symsagittifera roscoffensis TaxID=84072 RepID=UPI00307BC9F4